MRSWVWECFGVPAGALGDLWGMYWGLSGASTSPEESFQIQEGGHLGLVRLLLTAKDGLGPKQMAFGSHREASGYVWRLVF